MLNIKKKKFEVVEEEEPDYVEVKLQENKERFIREIIECGFERKDVTDVVNQGVYAYDKYFVIEKLNIIKAERALKEDA